MKVRRLTAAAGMLTIAASLTACAPTDRSADESTTPTTAPTAEATPTAQQPAPPATPADAAAQYRDGEFIARGWYGSLPSHHDVTLSIEGDVVVAIDITTSAEDEASLDYRRRFAEALPQAIVGRSIDGLDVDRLAGGPAAVPRAS